MKGSKVGILPLYPKDTKRTRYVVEPKGLDCQGGEVEEVLKEAEEALEPKKEVEVEEISKNLVCGLGSNVEEKEKEVLEEEQKKCARR